MTRIAIVKKERCNPVGCGNYLCIRVCPVNRAGKECIVIGADKKAQIDEKLCIGCNICAAKCPYESISIINLPEALKKNPIHRYGINGFALYSLPTPVKGKVVGIIGKNGIGKSTALKIIAGNLKPNLGEQGREAEYKELIEYFKGTESQKFIEDLRDGKIKISYKPQQVDLLSKTVKGTIKELLKKVDEKNQFDQIIQKLELTKVLDNDISEVSGGELQRVAIAATALKKADLYIFDEPTSYLDVNQRIKISHFIKELADENTSVLVVEHDLIILDYIADLVHLMYGKEACFGIVSGLKASRAGINTYLSGFLREENVRFRDYEIKFEPKPPTDVKKQYPTLIEWNKLHKKLGRFELKAEQGLITKKTTIGILGQNGIGKTTFAKILAGVIKQDSGELNENIRISYKPQYIDNLPDEIVMTILSEAMKYEAQLIKPLELKPLMLRKLHELSGGELQRVAIAECLAKEADLYLLDEPSAYLDVEQRLLVSKAINDMMFAKGASCLVIDHDVLFIDYLSEKLIVFNGEPARHGVVEGPYTMKEGMNHFLKQVGITMRRDPESKRPRINKGDSVKDREQKDEDKWYYT